MNQSLVRVPRKRPTLTNPYLGMPTSLKIGNFRFSVAAADVNESFAQGYFGVTNTLDQSIKLSPVMNAANLADVFIHEVLHAIHWHFELMDGEMGQAPSEEEFTTFTAHGLCQLWQDNPEAMLWWVKINSLNA